MDMKIQQAYFVDAVSFMHLNLVISPIGAICHPGDRFTHCFYDVGHHRSGQGSRHCMGQRREEECVLSICPSAVFKVARLGLG